MPDGQLFKVLQLGVGDRFDTWRWRGETERLARFYRERGYFTARVVPRRETDADGVALAGVKAVEARTRDMRAHHDRLLRRVEALERALAEALELVRALKDGGR